jgi:rod shape-determining protein MreB
MTADEKMDAAIIEHIKLKYQLLIPARTAELIKLGLVYAWPSGELHTMDIKGSDLATGRTRTLMITSDEIRDVLSRMKQ